MGRKKTNGGKMAPKKKCPTCNKPISIINFAKHTKIHKNNTFRNFICEMCGAGFTSKYSILNHFEKDHKNGMITNFRGNRRALTKLFVDAGVLQKVAAPLKCEKCSRIFQTKASRKRHIRDTCPYRSVQPPSEHTPSIEDMSATESVGQLAITGNSRTPSIEDLSATESIGQLTITENSNDNLLNKFRVMEMRLTEITKDRNSLQEKFKNLVERAPHTEQILRLFDCKVALRRLSNRTLDNLNKTTTTENQHQFNYESEDLLEPNDSSDDDNLSIQNEEGIDNSNDEVSVGNVESDLISKQASIQFDSILGDETELNVTSIASRTDTEFNSKSNPIFSQLYQYDSKLSDDELEYDESSDNDNLSICNEKIVDNLNNEVSVANTEVNFISNQARIEQLESDDEIQIVDESNNDNVSRENNVKSYNDLQNDENLSDIHLDVEFDSYAQLKRSNAQLDSDVDLHPCEKRSEGNINVFVLSLQDEEDEDEDEICVDPGLVQYLLPHQFEGIRFMFDVCFKADITKPGKHGNGCILSHCMGLGTHIFVHILEIHLYSYVYKRIISSSE